MSELPILFTGEMVRALLNTKPGVWPAEPIDPRKPRKWQTRRVVRVQIDDAFRAYHTGHAEQWEFEAKTHTSSQPCPYAIGQVRWVREAWQEDPAGKWGICFAATGHNPLCRIHQHLWRPSIFMPRWACRLRLEVKEVRCQRVREISYADCVAEGVEDEGFANDRYEFLWDSINAKRGYSWARNPWVWAVSLMRIL